MRVQEYGTEGWFDLSCGLVVRPVSSGALLANKTRSRYTTRVN
jgi:hypothetical protein